MNQQAIDEAKADLASALMQFHPELLTAITSDRGAAEIVEAIDTLIARHVLMHMAGSMHTSKS